MNIVGYHPGNTFLRRELDRRWHHWLIWCAVGALGLAIMLGGIVGPRQTTVRLRYEIAQVKAEVEALQRTQRTLQLELETQLSPHALTATTAEQGLTAVLSDRLLFLNAAGELVGGAKLFPPSPAVAGDRQ